MILFLIKNIISMLYKNYNNVKTNIEIYMKFNLFFKKLQVIKSVKSLNNKYIFF